MKHLALFLAFAGPLLAVAACCGPSNPQLTATSVASPSLAPSAPPSELKGADDQGKGVVSGTVLAPLNHVGRVIPVGGANVVASGGANVIPVGGGNVIPVGGGHVITAGLNPLRRVLSVEESPLANATVYLADASGNAYPGIPSTTTDAQGKFTFTDVPSGQTFMVMVAAQDQGRGKEVTLQTLVRTTEAGATANVTTATSLVTLAVTDGQSDLGDFDAAAFNTATESTAKQLKAEDVPDLGDRPAVLAKVDELSKATAELQQSLDTLKQEVQNLKDSLEALQQQLASTPAPGQTTPPPQGGMRPPGGGCPSWQAHDFVLARPYRYYPLILYFLDPGQNRVVATVRFDGPAPSKRVIVPECWHRMVLVDDHNAIVADAPFDLRQGAPSRIFLPF